MYKYINNIYFSLKSMFFITSKIIVHQLFMNFDTGL